MNLKTGVLYVVSHLTITLFAFLLYGVIYIMRGEPDPTLQNILLMIAGYWFGAMGHDVLKRRTEKPDKQADIEKGEGGQGV